MALSQLKTWIAEILTASDLNAEFQQIYTNSLNLISPLTGTLAAAANSITLDSDADSSISAASDDVINLTVQNFAGLKVDGTTASSVNGLTITTSATGNPIQITNHGEDDIGIKIEAKNNEEMLILAAVAAAVNEITITSASTGNNPKIACTGEADTGITFQNSEGEEILILDSIASSVNELTIKSAATGNKPIIAATGEADNGIEFHNDQSEEILILQSAAGSVNEVTITSAATGVGPTIASSGETNVDLNISTAGTGAVNITGGDSGVAISAGASGVVTIGNASLQFPNSDGSASQVLQTNGSAVLSWADFGFPRGHIAGLQMTHDPDTDNQAEISISDGECRNTGNTTNMVLAAALKKTIDNTWTSGAGGGLNDTEYAAAGSDAAPSTWYHVFMLSSADGTTVDAGFDSDVDAMNLLADVAVEAAGLTKYRRIGSVRTDAFRDILDFFQHGEEFVWEVQVQGYVGLTLDFSSGADITNAYVPPDVAVMATCAMNVDLLTAAEPMVLTPDGTAIAQPTSNNNPGQIQGNSTTEVHRPLNMLHVDQKITARTNTDSSITFALTTISYTDSRGRHD